MNSCFPIAAAVLVRNCLRFIGVPEIGRPSQTGGNRITQVSGKARRPLVAIGALVRLFVMPDYLLQRFMVSADDFTIKLRASRLQIAISSRLNQLVGHTQCDSYVVT